ncbi:MAG: type II toxin-antitoxin system VapB family antitoxin [Syntrophorhabdales bacterium]
MRTTLNIDDSLIDKASKMTGIKEKTALVRLGLEALIARESASRLARLFGRSARRGKAKCTGCT